MESWEQLRAQARKIEGDVERALPKLASLAADGDSGAEAQRLLKTVEDHLKALARVRDSLQAEEAREPSPARKAVVERCRAVVVDYSSDVGRVAKQLRKNADRAKLFSGADDVVDLEGGPDHLKGVHRERKATTNALRGVGDVIEQAHEAQSDLASQRETLEGSTNTAQSLTDRLPSIDSIIQKMRQKKYRENAVVGVTVGCCASFLLWAVLARVDASNADGYHQAIHSAAASTPPTTSSRSATPTSRTELPRATVRDDYKPAPRRSRAPVRGRPPASLSDARRSWYLYDGNNEGVAALEPMLER